MSGHGIEARSRSQAASRRRSWQACSGWRTSRATRTRLVKRSRESSSASSGSGIRRSRSRERVLGRLDVGAAVRAADLLDDADGEPVLTDLAGDPVHPILLGGRLGGRCRRPARERQAGAARRHPESVGSRRWAHDVACATSRTDELAGPGDLELDTTSTASNDHGRQCYRILERAFLGYGLRCESGRTHTQCTSRSSSVHGVDPTPSVSECDPKPHPSAARGLPCLPGVLFHVPDPRPAVREHVGADRLLRLRRLRRLLVRARRRPADGHRDARPRPYALTRTPNPAGRAAGVS